MKNDFPVVRDTALRNGLRLLVIPTPHLHSAHCALFVRVGSRNETRETNGLTHMLEHMLFRGTRSFDDAPELNAAVEQFGGFLDAVTYRDHVVFSTPCLPEGVSKALHVLGELVSTPRYRKLNIEREIIREEILETLDSDGAQLDISNIAREMLFRDHPLGLPIEGTLENVLSFGRTELDGHRRQFFSARNSVLVASGPVDAEEVREQAERAFAGYEAGESALVDPPSPFVRGPLLRVVPDQGSQVDVRLSLPALGESDPLFLAQTLLVRILSDGMSSRLQTELVDRKGLAYNLGAFVESFPDAAVLDVDVSVAPDKVALAAREIWRLLRGIALHGVTDEELKRARRRFALDLAYLQDSPGDLATFYGRSALFNRPIDLQPALRRLRAIRGDDVKAIAQQVFVRGGLAAAVVGNLGRREQSRLREALP